MTLHQHNRYIPQTTPRGCWLYQQAFPHIYNVFNSETVQICIHVSTNFHQACPGIFSTPVPVKPRFPKPAMISFVLCFLRGQCTRTLASLATIQPHSSYSDWKQQINFIVGPVMKHLAGHKAAFRREGKHPAMKIYERWAVESWRTNMAVDRVLHGLKILFFIPQEKLFFVVNVFNWFCNFRESSREIKCWQIPSRDPLTVRTT